MERTERNALARPRPLRVLLPRHPEDLLIDQRLHAPGSPEGCLDVTQPTASQKWIEHSLLESPWAGHGCETQTTKPFGGLPFCLLDSPDSDAEALAGRGTGMSDARYS